MRLYNTHLDHENTYVFYFSKLSSFVAFCIDMDKILPANMSANFKSSVTDYFNAHDEQIAVCLNYSHRHCRWSFSYSEHSWYVQRYSEAIFVNLDNTAKFITTVEDLFYTFLVFVNAYEQFCEYPDESFINFDEYCIDEAFDWSNTEEGYSFWMELSTKWANLYKTYKDYLQ